MLVTVVVAEEVATVFGLLVTDLVLHDVVVVVFASAIGATRHHRKVEGRMLVVSQKQKQIFWIPFNSPLNIQNYLLLA